MPETIKENSWFVIPLVSAVLAGLVAYFATQIDRERQLTALQGTLDSLHLRVSILEKWVEKTEGNRFTNKDADSMEQHTKN